MQDAQMRGHSVRNSRYDRHSFPHQNVAEEIGSPRGRALPARGLIRSDKRILPTYPNLTLSFGSAVVLRLAILLDLNPVTIE